MKKIIGILLAGALVTSAFAVDFTARVNTKITAAGGTLGENPSVYLLQANNTDQKDADLLEVHFAGDKAGADFKLFTKAADSAVSMRGLGLWFKPIDMLKFNVGYVNYGTFCEHTDWWKAVSGVGVNALSGWSNFATVDGFGAMVTLNPIAGLEFNAGVTPGADGKFIEIAGESFKSTAWGASVKADLNAFAEIPVVAAVSFRDAGKDKEKILAVGASYGQEYSGNFYGFINARMRFESSKFVAVALDNWFKFTFDALGIQLAVPVTLRLTGDVNDPSWMGARLKVTYNMGAATPYVYAESTALRFDDKLVDNFGMCVRPGVTFNVGVCAIDAGVQFDINKAWDFEYSKGINWSVPVTFAVAF